MKNMVISGAGPVGLYLAIRLNQIIQKYNLNTNVTVIDPRAGEYERPGIVANMALALLSQNIGKPITSVKDGDDSGTSMFIQDLEKALYARAKEIGITVIRASFAGFASKNIMVKTSKDELKSIACDVALDCSGSRRALIKKFNETNPEQPFEIKDVAKNPLKNHFIAYINMDSVNAEKMVEKAQRDPVRRILALEKLRSEFGWSEFVEPEFHLRRYVLKGSDGKADQVRFYLYFEVPESLTNLPKIRQLEWLNALICLKTERDDIEFEIESGKMKFNPFFVDPHKVVQPALFNDKHGITVIPCGDAQIEPDYRIGIGIFSGVKRANALLESIVIDHKRELSFNTKQYAVQLQEPMGRHELELEKDYRLKRESLCSALETEKARYASALEKTGNEQEKIIIQSGLNEIETRIAIKKLNNYLIEFTKILEGKSSLQSHEREAFLNPDVLKNHEEALSKGLDSCPNSSLSPEGKIKTELLELAKSYKKIAGLLFAKKQLAKSEKLYQQCINFYSEYFPGSYLDEIAKIYSNLVIIMTKEKKFEEAIGMADQALEALSRIDQMVDKEKLTIKVRFNKSLALLGNILDMADKKGDPLEIKKQLSAAQKLCEELMDSPHIGEKGASDLRQRLDKVYLELGIDRIIG